MYIGDLILFIVHPWSPLLSGWVFSLTVLGTFHLHGNYVQILSSCCCLLEGLLDNANSNPPIWLHDWSKQKQCFNSSYYWYIHIIKTIDNCRQASRNDYKSILVHVWRKAGRLIGWVFVGGTRFKCPTTCIHFKCIATTVIRY